MRSKKQKNKPQVTPEMMTVICNIQGLEDVISDKFHTFAELANMTYDELFELQNSLIPNYNRAIRERKGR